MCKSSPACQDNSLYLIPKWAFPGVVDPAELILQPQLVVNEGTVGLIASFIGWSEPNLIKSAQGVSDLAVARDLIEHHLVSWIWPNTRLKHILILYFEFVQRIWAPASKHVVPHYELNPIFRIGVMLFVKSFNHLPDKSAKEVLNASFSTKESTAGTCCDIEDLVSPNMKMFYVFPSDDIYGLIYDFAHQIKAFWLQRTHWDHFIRLLTQVFELFALENIFQMTEGLHQGNYLGSQIITDQFNEHANLFSRIAWISIIPDAFKIARKRKHIFKFYQETWNHSSIAISVSFKKLDQIHQKGEFRRSSFQIKVYNHLLENHFLLSNRNKSETILIRNVLQNQMVHIQIICF